MPTQNGSKIFCWKPTFINSSFVLNGFNFIPEGINILVVNTMSLIKKSELQRHQNYFHSNNRAMSSNRKNAFKAEPGCRGQQAACNHFMGKYLVLPLDHDETTRSLFLLVMGG